MLYSGDKFRRDLWSFAWTSTLDLEQCAGGGDEDQDGRVACADSDCAYSALCP